MVYTVGIMNDTELYRHILGLEAPWQVTRVELDIVEETVCVFVDYDPQTASFVCSECGKPACVYDHREQRTWRHLDSCQFKTYLLACIPRVECREHGVQTARVCWCEPNSRFTLLF